MPKLYKMTKSVVFFSEKANSHELREEGEMWLARDDGAASPDVFEVTSLDEMPEGWTPDCVPWGQDGDTSAGQWFDETSRKKIATLEKKIAKLNEELNSLVNR